MRPGDEMKLVGNSPGWEGLRDSQHFLPARGKERDCPSGATDGPVPVTPSGKGLGRPRGQIYAGSGSVAPLASGAAAGGLQPRALGSGRKQALSRAPSGRGLALLRLAGMDFGCWVGLTGLVGTSVPRGSD